MKTTFTLEEFRELFIAAMLSKPIIETTQGELRVDSEILDIWNVPEMLYQPNALLALRISEYNQLAVARSSDKNFGKQNTEKLGNLMEEIACLAFSSLDGWDSIKSHQSYSAQYDLVISGSDKLSWWVLMKYLQLPIDRRTIVIEAKNLRSTISNTQFLRLCSIVHYMFDGTCHLGVFFSSLGASGFPNAGISRQRTLGRARATQIIFHAKTGRYVVVFDGQDIQQLTQKGALPRLLKAKIQDVEEASGLPLEFDSNWKEIDLPPHLSQYLT